MGHDVRPTPGQDGLQIGLYRDGIRLLPIKLWPPEAERDNVASMRDIPVTNPLLNFTVPIGQIVSSWDKVWEDAKIRKRNRIFTITASCNPRAGLASPLLNRLRPQIEDIALPPGYFLEWGGEWEDSRDANEAIATTLPMGFLTMIIVVILLFAKVRQPLIIWLTVPLSLIGVTLGLLLLRQPFGFMALLGLMSLSGMLIKNAIVLIDEINLQIREGKEKLAAVVDSGASRLVPVGMAASTTALGMIPLVLDAFFVSMAVTIIGGLVFASVLTMFFVPVLYTLFFKIKV